MRVMRPSSKVSHTRLMQRLMIIASCLCVWPAERPLSPPRRRRWLISCSFRFAKVRRWPAKLIGFFRRRLYGPATHQRASRCLQVAELALDLAELRPDRMRAPSRRWRPAGRATAPSRASSPDWRAAHSSRRLLPLSPVHFYWCSLPLSIYLSLVRSLANKTRLTGRTGRRHDQSVGAAQRRACEPAHVLEPETRTPSEGGREYLRAVLSSSFRFASELESAGSAGFDCGPLGGVAGPVQGEGEECQWVRDR